MKTDINTNADIDGVSFFSPQFNLVKLDDFHELYMQTFSVSPSDSGKLRSKPVDDWHRLAKVSSSHIETYPIYTNPFTKRYLSSKNGRISTIIFERNEFKVQPTTADDAITEINNLLSWRVFDSCSEGLGLNLRLSDLWLSLSILKKVDTMVVINANNLSIDDNRLLIPNKTLDDIRKAFNRGVKNRNEILRMAKRRFVRDEILTVVDPENFPEIIEIEPHTKLVELRVNRRSREDRVRVYHDNLNVIRRDIKEIAEDIPKVLFELHSEIERVTLSGMVDKFEIMIKDNLTEPKWQKFFEDNVFILTMLFSSSVHIIQKQFHAKPSSLNGAGSQIGDFLFGDNSRTLSIIEIKHPGTILMNDKKEYRNDVYAPGFDLVGAMTQVLTQKHMLVRKWMTHADDNPSLNEYSPKTIKCVILAGMKPEKKEVLDSFNIFRNSCKDVDIFTYDELLDKLKLLREYLARNETI